MPLGVDSGAVDPAARIKMTEYMQAVLTQICGAAAGP
jgi:hypothetical protein